LSKRKAILNGVKVLGLLLVLAFLYWMLGSIGFRDILEAMKRTRLSTLAAAVGLQFAVFLLWSFRLQLLMPRAERHSIVTVFPIYLAGVLGNIVTPGARVGGEPIRAYYMAKVYGGEKSKHFGLLVIDKLGNLAVSMAFVLLSVGFVAVFVPLAMWMKVVLEVIVLLIIAGIVSGFLLRKHIGVSGLLGKLMRLAYNFPVLKLLRDHFPTYQQFEDYVIRKLENVTAPTGRAVRSPKALSKLIILSLVAWLLFYLSHYVLFVGLGAGVGFFAVLIIVAISNFCGDISASPGGIGFMEAVMIGLCAAFGIEHSTAAAVTIISRGVFYFFGLGVGGTSFLVLALLYGRARGGKAEAAEGEDA